MTERYEETVGRTPTHDPYIETGAIDRNCPTCSAPVGERCTFLTSVISAGRALVAERKTRHHPCLARFIRRTHP